MSLLIYESFRSKLSRRSRACRGGIQKNNHRNTLKYFEDYNLSLTQRLGKIAILGQPPKAYILQISRYKHSSKTYVSE